MGIFRTGCVGCLTGLDARHDVVGTGFLGEMPPPDQPFTQGTAQKGASHQAESGRRHRDGTGSGKAHLFEKRGESARCPVPAAHRDGTGRHTQQGAESHAFRDAHGQQILHNDQDGDQKDHHKQRLSALTEHLQVALIAHRREKDHHAQVFDGPVEDAFDTEPVQGEGQQRDDQTA